MQMIQYAHLYDRIACQNLHRFRDYFNQALCCTAAFSNGGVHEFIGNGSTYIRRRSFFLPFFNLCIIHRLQKNVDFINTSFLKFLRLAVFLNILRSGLRWACQRWRPAHVRVQGGEISMMIIDKGYEQSTSLSWLSEVGLTDLVKSNGNSGSTCFWY